MQNKLITNLAVFLFLVATTINIANALEADDNSNVPEVNTATESTGSPSLDSEEGDFDPALYPATTTTSDDEDVSADGETVSSDEEV
ncbi:MAG: hypothetical protein GY909_00835 [Oligoflexia bacterium]|nr:hypothetical protein [Oligoflexia bacterium]